MKKLKNKSLFLFITIIILQLFNTSCTKKTCRDDNTIDFKINIKDENKTVFISTQQWGTGNDFKYSRFSGSDNTEHIHTVKNLKDYSLSYHVVLINNIDTTIIDYGNINFKDENYKTCKIYELDF